MDKVNVYIDGFNLYFGMTEKLNNVKWLNVYDMAIKLLQDDQELNEVNYFTSMVSNSPDKERRQSAYIDALKTTPINLFFGQYKSKTIRCNSCKHSWGANEEKMTDVNIAVQMLVDAMNDEYDVAILISGDSDLIPPIRAIKQNFPNKRVVVAFPPKRHNNSVKNEAQGSFTIGRKTLQSNQFPDQLTLENGYIKQARKLVKLPLCFSITQTHLNTRRKRKCKRSLVS